ncbi:MAG: inosine-5-monophosphate dehydrogenase [Rhodospirillaceae bacterium]|nr:MAG: inosine-5-monophosphate dehydrogenase [Rhodospirillaceae bacterium]
MNIKHVIPHKTDKTLTINSAETVKAAIRLLHTKGVGLLIVVDDQAELFGVVSERDVIRVLDEKGAEALDMPIADLSTRDVITCPGEAHPHDVLDKMFEHNIRHMPVMEGGKITSLVSSRDLIKYVAKHLKPDEQAMLWAKLIQLH